jgi:hypothetical protein
MMSFLKGGVIILSLLCASPAWTQERCLRALYQLPEHIGEEMRPYLVCGLLQRDGHHGTLLNGQSLRIQGGELEDCGPVRSRAVSASEQRLVAAIADPSARRSFIEAEFAKADRFLKEASRSDDLAVGDAPSAPRCRNQNAKH